MYKITVQSLTGTEHTIYYPGNKSYSVKSAVVSPEVGLAGEFKFTIPADNLYYGEITQNAIITIYKDNNEWWRGDIKDIKANFDKSLDVYCVEDLAWLGEEPVAMSGVSDESYAQRFNAVLSAYNTNQAAKRQFTVGSITNVNSSDICAWYPEYGMSVLSALRAFISGDNGYLKVRRVTSNGAVIRYIDIITLADYGKQSSQTVLFGSNLIDFVKDMDTTNIVNALYPYGAETETKLYADVMQRISGTAIQNNDSIAIYGRRARTVTFDTDDVDTLDRLAAAYLSRYSQPQLTIEVSAVDLGSVQNVDTFQCGDSVRVKAIPYNIDQWLYITKLDIDLLNPANNQIKLSDVVRHASLTNQMTSQANAINGMRSADSILNEANANALAILNSDNDGVITFVRDQDNQIIEQRIANNTDIDQATKAWRWNLNGLGYLHRQYPSDDWTVGIAMTMDGQIVADYITTGTLNADRVKVKGKIEATSGYIGDPTQGWDIGNNAIYNGPSSVNDTSTPGMYVGADGIRTNGSLWGYSGASTLIKGGAIDCNSTIKTAVIFASSGQINSFTASTFEIGDPNVLSTINGRFNNTNGMTIQTTPDSSQFALLHVNRSGTSLGRWVSWSSSSDIRLKENIKPIEADFVRDFFDKVRPISFNYNYDEEKKTEYGLIAQELEQVFEELDDSNNAVILELEGKEAYKAIKYEKLIGIMIPAIKDLYAQIDELKNEIKILKEERNG